MTGTMCVTVGDARVHLDQLAACVTTAEGYTLTREQWIAFAMSIIQALITMFGGGSSAEKPPEKPPEKPEPPEPPGLQRPDRPRPR